MKKYGLLSEVRRRRQWVNLGQQVHKYENLLNRQYQAVRPNEKWVTDISYIHTKEGILYLSMIQDLYDNSIVAYKTASRQTVNLVLDTIRLAMKKEKVAAELQLHSDQGIQYTSQAYFKLTQSYGITPSMSRKGNPYDNAMADNFFSILKTECIYRHKPKTLQEANELIDRYIYFYNHERIQTTGVAGGLHKPYKGVGQPRLKAHEKSSPIATLLRAAPYRGRLFICPCLLAHP